MELLECLVGILIPLFVIYKLIDHLIRWPTIGQYADRYILVTGCDTGFGYAIARRLDKLGCHVFAACLTEAGQLKLAGTCSERMHALIMDVTNHDSILWAYDNVKSRLPVGKGRTGCILVVWFVRLVIRCTRTCSSGRGTSLSLGRLDGQ